MVQESNGSSRVKNGAVLQATAAATTRAVPARCCEWAVAIGENPVSDQGCAQSRVPIPAGRTQIDVRAPASTFAILAGTPNSLLHTSASTATPSRICWCDGLAKHSRSRLPAWALSVDHSGPGLIATPAASAAWYSFNVSTLSGSFTQRKMPPLGSSNSADVPNCSPSASISVSSLARRPRVSFGTWDVKCGLQYSASTICSSAPDPASVFSASIRDSTAQGATMKPTRSAGAIDLVNEPIWMTPPFRLIA